MMMPMMLTAMMMRSSLQYPIKLMPFAFSYQSDCQPIPPFWLASNSCRSATVASPCDWKKRRRKSRSTWLSLESSPSRVSMRTSPGPADSSFTAMEGRKRSLSSESASTFSCLRKLGAYGGAKLIRRRHVAEGCYFTVANKL